MFKNLNKLIKILIFSCIFLIVVPACFASNDTDMQIAESLTQGEDTEPLELSEGDKNPVGVDYYFDSSSNDTGDGSEENPYNELTLTRLKTSSTIHLANGQYNLSSGKTLNKVTIIGQDPEKTIINYNGASSSGKFSIGLDDYLILSNVTLIGFNFDVEGGTFEATNTIFKNSVASFQSSAATNLVNSASNSFGGTIYAYFYQSYADSYLPSVSLYNCTFDNNTAEYGGAICMNKGDLYIENSLFINNYAYNYGGAVAGLYDVNVKVKNSKFINDISLNDAGGAIYLLQSRLSATDMSAVNCSATFGAAITSLNSTVALSGFNAINNTAKYDGGAIFQMYNGITVSDSYFEDNKAQNGGAIYVDGAQIFTMEYNNFNNNIAENTAGAVYSLLNNKTTIKNNNYSGNKANKNDDLYQTNSIIVNIGNGNYTLFYNNYTFNGVLPSYYSLIDEELVTPVKDQQSGGNCWSFGAIAALESAVLKASGITYDFSEENVKNLMQTYSDYGWAGIETNDGGYDDMAIAYLANWLGPVSEDIEEYDDYSMLSPVLNAITHVQNIVYLGRNTYTDNDAIKEALMKYGAVSTGIYYDSTYFSSAKKAYYYYGSSYANHAVAIVGWDDNYSKDNFYYKPAGDGAWIVKNSWNADWGDKGYFYVSYYDTRLAEVGDNTASFAFILNDTEKYDKNYQYDLVGKTDYLLTGENTVWAQNIFKSTDNELLAAVSTYFRKSTSWELFVYINDQLALDKNGSSTPGYVTIDLGEKIPVSIGDEFKIVFKFTSDDGAEIPISEKITANKLTYSPGTSFFSFDGKNWTDLFYYTDETELDDGHSYISQVACIKAFTILYELQPSIRLSVSNMYNIANISAVVLDQYDNIIRSGNVTFNIEGENQTVKIENDCANLTNIFKSNGIQEFTVFYRNVNATYSLNITKIFIDLGLNIEKNKNNVSIALTSLYNVNTTVVLNSNNKTYYIDLKEGKGSLQFTDLDFGLYNLTASVFDENYAGDVASSFNITVSKTRILADDLISYYSFERDYSMLLEDIYGNPISNHQISVVIDGKAYVAMTNEMGVATISVNLNNKSSSSKINMMFYGDDRYFASGITTNAYLKSSIILPNTTTFLTNSKYDVTLLDFNGNPVSSSKANVFVVDGVDYWEINNKDGIVSKDLEFGLGSHEITIVNSLTGEKVSQNISLISRIMENKDVTAYYTASSYYKVRVYDDANIAKSGELVTFTVNKKNYSVKVDNNGYASFKLSGLKSGSYSITASYKGVKVSNKITIKPLLTTKNISVKKGKTVKFTAKLISNKGKVLKNKKITFKVNKKTYKIKTNKKGVATLKLKNLKVGKYKITSKYGKSSCTNTIKIKK